MLKIEKVSRHYDVILQLTQRKIFSYPFLKALCLASLLHFLALLIFHIGPFKIEISGHLPPAFVDTEIAEQEMNVVAQIQGEKKALKFQRAPKGFSLSLPSISTSIPRHHLESIQEPDFLNHPFLKLENDLLTENFFAVQKKRMNPLFEITLGGSLAKNKQENIETLINDESILSLLKPLGSLHVVYTAKIENKTGRIFFLEPKDTSLTDTYQKVISQILTRITFYPIEKGFVTSGEITIDYDSN